MSREFVCKIDGRSFLTKEEAMAYLESTFLDEVEKEEGLEDTEAELKKAFPQFRVKVTKEPLTSDHVSYADENDPFFNGKEIVYVTLNGIDLDADLRFEIKPRHEDDFHYDSRDSYETLEKAISFYHSFIDGSLQYAHNYLEELRKYEPNATSAKVTRIHQSCGTADDFYEYDVDILNSSDQVIASRRLELDEYDVEDTAGILREIKKDLIKVKGHYVTELEGHVTMGSAKYCNDHSTWYEVDGVAIDALAYRADKEGKKLRVQIVN